ncbi:glucose-1-phosphate thymidylyltransferase RfbA [Gammaproteobacteria bacterium]|jgi:glucose-1-phosphate thymidylyltransferase|nr:glucose-1-phosphate thymidylyltransferase RfbA [Gammaproteobacteria bacterium]
MKNRKGIILAGGSGSRLYPITQSISKQILPVFDKPMIYYPLCTLMLAGIKDILIITTPRDSSAFRELLGSGERWGVNLSYEIQKSPDGIAQAFIIGKDFIDNHPCALILGDNIFYGHDLPLLLQNADLKRDLASVFAYHVNDPDRYGVVEFNSNNKAISIEEKPKNPKSNYALTGLYFYDNQVCDIASTIKPSSRGELEITDVNKIYLSMKKLDVEIMGRGFAWLDTGTHESLYDASGFISTLQKRQGTMICCPEEIAYLNDWITKDSLIQCATELSKNQYGRYLFNLIKEK